MKKAFIITSSIEVDNDYPLTYSQIRSFFTSEERLRQTIYTICSIDSARDNDIDIFLLDASNNWEPYKNILQHYKNINFISIKENLPHIFDTVRTHPNKSHCETLIVKTFLETYYSIIKDYDFFLKISGRYFIDSTFDSKIFSSEKSNKLFFKNPLEFEWNETWQYNLVDRRSIQGNNKLYQYSSVLYGWGKDYFDKILDINRIICDITNKEDGKKYDIETLMYYFTRDFEQDIILVPWKVNGWYGADGRYLRY